MFFPFMEWFYNIGLEVIALISLVVIYLYLQQYYRGELRKIIKDSPLATMIIDEKSGVIRFANRAAIQQLDVRQVGKQFFYPSSVSAQHVRESLSQVEGKGFSDHALNWQVSTVKTLFFILSGKRLRYKRSDAWLVYFVEKQDSYHEASQLETSLKMARSAFDSLSELIYIKDNSGHIVNSNRAFNHFWYGRMEEGKAIASEDKVSQINQRHWTTDPEGRSCLLETTLTPIVSEEGEILGSLGLSHDVTDWFYMQQNLRHEMEKRRGTEATLEQRETILQSILDASPDAIALFYENGVFEACNQAYLKSIDVFSLPPEEVRGKKLVDVISSELIEEFVESDYQVIQNGGSIRFIDEVSHRDGRTQWYDVTKSRYKDPVSGLYGVLLLARDITENYLAEQKMSMMNRELERLSFVDGLTQIANRRRFDEQLDVLWKLHKREKQPLTLMLCDIDFFKKYNDYYGHQKGDQALQKLAKSFQNVLTRESDGVARYGGEEFVFLLPNTTIEGAQLVSGRIHKAVSELAIEHKLSPHNGVVTLSIGVAVFSSETDISKEELIARADSALYSAKEQGRNQTRYYSEL